MTVFCTKKDKISHVLRMNWLTVLTRAITSIILIFGLLGTHANANSIKTDAEFAAMAEHLKSFERASERLTEINHVIDTLDSDTPMARRIELDIIKLITLTDIGDVQKSASFADELYRKRSREDYESDELYADVMQKVVEAVAKTQNIGLAYKIVQHMRESVYHKPNAYLSYKIDKSLTEIYNESFDFNRSLNVVLSILDNPDYVSLPDYESWKESLLNEAAFLYNRLGNAEMALEYLNKAKAKYESVEQTPKDLLKKQARNDGNRGRAYLMQGDYVGAEKLGRSVLEAGKQLEQNYVIALGYRLIGSASYNLGRYGEAKAALEVGIALADKHDIALMQKNLYKDYALTLKKLGLYEDALTWTERLTVLEVQAREASAVSRNELILAEERARSSFEEVVELKRQNETQRELADRDRRNSNLLMTVTALLLVLVSTLGYLFYFLRKSQRKLISSQVELIESEKKANIANKAKSDFLANMSHEIRTPLNGVLGMLDVLRRTKLTEQQRAYTDIINKSGHNLLNLLSDILDLSKVESGKYSLNPEPCNLKDVIRDCVNLFSASASEKNLHLNFQYDSDLPTRFNTDINRIRQIVSNLIGNAIKFTLEGQVIVAVTGTVRGDYTDIKIAVQDSGIGIESDKLAMIFEEFTQAENSTTRRFGGTGLGLTISRKIAQTMKGQLGATSEFGHGATFTLELPLKSVQPIASVSSDMVVDVVPGIPQHNSPAVSAVTRAAPEIRKNSKFNFLVVEDDEINRLVFTTFLKHPRIELTLAENGQEAVEAFKGKKFDMVFMDISMPVMDGMVATQIIRDHEKQQGHQRTPIICLSAHAMEDQSKQFLAAGMDDYMSKPIQRDRLIKLMSKWLKAPKTSKVA